jgi:hypothetical protein
MEQDAWFPGFDNGTGDCQIDRHQITAGSQVEQLSAVLPPPRFESTAGRYIF